MNETEVARSDRARIPPRQLVTKTCRAYRDCRNVISWFFWLVVRARYLLITPVASPPCRRIASFLVNESRSCISRSLVRPPQRGDVRILLAVAGPPFCTIPSPVPTLCNRKSLYGWITLLPNAAGTVNVPPLITVPAGEVVIDVT